jgi:acyl-CoA dehydrogenase
LRARSQCREISRRRSRIKACQTAVTTHGGYGYAKEYHVERYFREIMIPKLAPVSPQLILCFIAEKVLGLPRSY